MEILSTVEDVEALLGTPARVVLAKATDVLDDGCRAVLAAAPLAGVGFRDAEGEPHTTVVGGAIAESRNRLSFALAPRTPRPAAPGVSMLFLMVGVGETLRINGTLIGIDGARVTIDLDEAYVHCARCVLRSRLWRDGHPAATVSAPVDGPLAEPGIAAFLAASPFALLSSWDGDGHGDTSPRGDLPGFLQVLDGQTLALPDRRGNRRADTLRNLMSCPAVSLAALVPGRAEMLHLRGTATVTTDPALLATMALQGKPPHAAVTVHVDAAAVEPAPALQAAWNGRPTPGAPDMNAVGAGHLTAGAGAGTRALVRAAAGATAGLARRALDISYRRALRDEGY